MQSLSICPQRPTFYANMDMHASALGGYTALITDKHTSCCQGFFVGLFIQTSWLDTVVKAVQRPEECLRQGGNMLALD